MNNCCTLIAVSDMDRSKQFYHDLLGLEVAADFGANVPSPAASPSRRRTAGPA